MKVYRIEHDGINIGPANLYWKLSDLNEHLGDDFCLSPQEFQAIALCEGLIANHEDLGPNFWGREFRSLWKDAQKDDKHYSYLFGASFDYFMDILMILKSHQPFISKEKAPFQIDEEYTHYIKSQDHKNAFYSAERDEYYHRASIIRNYHDFKKETLFAFGSEVWRSVFATDIMGKRFVIACYEVTKAQAGPGGQIAFHKDDILERTILYRNDDAPSLNLSDFSHFNLVETEENLQETPEESFPKTPEKTFPKLSFCAQDILTEIQYPL